LTGQSTSPSITPAAPPEAAPLLPPAALTAALRGTRPLKRWRWVGIFGEQLMVCAAQVQIGPARQSFWALYDSAGGELRERTHMFPRGEVDLLPAPVCDGELAGEGRLRLRDGGVELELVLAEEPGVRVICPHGRGEVWTRKQAGVAAHGTLRLDGGPVRDLSALAVIDDTAGHHARRTEWFWSAGVGESPQGTPLAWNLVSGVNDPRTGSERAVWQAGSPHEAAPVSFAPDLSELTASDGSRLCFSAVAERSRRDRLLIVSSDYRAPFGTFSGTLPGGIELARGIGVMEHHRARW
jgi:hypothetical protein